MDPSQLFQRLRTLYHSPFARGIQSQIESQMGHVHLSVSICLLSHNMKDLILKIHNI